MNDTLNVFERRQPRGTLADDRKTRFAKLHERRSAALRESNTLEDRVERNAAQRASWSGDARAGGLHTASGVTLDAETARLKVAAEESRKPKPSVAPEPTDATVYAVASRWMADHLGFYRSPHNGENFKRFMLAQTAAGKLTWDYESFSVAHDWLQANGYFEKPPAPRRREFAMTTAPKVYPPFLSAEERADADAQRRAEHARRMGREIERAVSLPFEQLRREVRAGFTDLGRAAEVR